MHIMCGVFRHMGRETVGYNQNLIVDLQDFGKLRNIPRDRINLIWQIYFSRSLLKISSDCKNDNQLIVEMRRDITKTSTKVTIRERPFPPRVEVPPTRRSTPPDPAEG
jgi:hypothetical protein